MNGEDLPTTSVHRYDHGARLASRLSELDVRARTHGTAVASGSESFSVYPAMVKRTKGPLLWDVDGNEFIDFVLAYGTVILGHCDPYVDEAVVKEIRSRVAVAPMWSPTQLELAELLTSVLPGAERVFFLKTGSDATSAAVRLARIFTSRDRVLRCGYNGWHDWCNPHAAGVPAAVRALTETFEVDDIAGFKSLLHKGPLPACVVLMPFELTSPNPTFMTTISDLCRGAGVVFVLDEMRSGFRVALGGVKERFGVASDLSCYSKSLANGYEISVLAGRADIMDCITETKISSAYFANPAPQRAAIATVERLRADPPHGRLERLGFALSRGLSELASKHGVGASVHSHPTSPFVDFFSLEEDERRELFRLFASNGLLLHPNHQWFVSASHTEQHIDRALDGAAKAFVRLRAISRG